MPTADVRKPDSAAPIVLDLNQLDELFSAPAVDPFSTRELDVLGSSGIDFLRKRCVAPFPRRPAARELHIHLAAANAAPAGQDAGTLAQSTRAAIQRYCRDQISRNQAEMRLAILRAGQELRITLVVTVVAIALLALLYYKGLNVTYSGLQALLTILAVFAVALTSWDALESLFFDWVPFGIDVRAYQWISALNVRIETVAPAGQDATSATTPQP